MFAYLSAALGIFSVSYFPRLPPLWLVFLLALLLFLLVYCRRWYVFLWVLGLLYGIGYGHYLLNRQLSASLEGKVFIAEGRVEGLPVINSGSQRFHFRLHKLEALEGEVDEKELAAMQGKKVTLSWYHQYGSSIQEQNQLGLASVALASVTTGDYWRFEIKLRRPRGFVNPAGFDYQLYLLQQQLMASGYVRNSRHNVWLENQCPVWVPDCWRQSLRSIYSSGDSQQDLERPDSQIGPLLGLLIGDRQAMTEDQWQLLRNTGTIHLMAISGLHIGLAALIGFSIGRFFLKLWQFVGPRRTLVWLPSFTSLVLAGGYSLLAGMTLPTQRALIMVVLLQWLLLNKRRVNPWSLVSFALFAIALLDPLSIRSQGFWLSFLAVITLLFSFFGRRVIKTNTGVSQFFRPIWPLIKAQWVIALGLLVPVILLLQGVSLSSPFANLIAVPLVSLFTVPLLFLSLAIIPLSTEWSLVVFNWAGFTLEWLFIGLKWFDSLPLNFWMFDRGEVSLFAVLFSVLGVIWLLSPKGIPARWLGLVCFLPLIFSSKHQLPLKMTVFDVGQGTAVVVETKKHQLVYDTGRRFSQRFNAGEHIVAPYLFQQGHKNIDQLIISHSDNDHAGGAEGLLSVVAVTEVLAGEPKRVNSKQCLAGQSWQWDGVSFSVIWPTQQYLHHRQSGDSSNNASCVLLIEYENHSILLAGDIERAVEQQLLANQQLPEDLSVLLVPHHGSLTSSHGAWVRYLQPRFSVVTAGFFNRYNHPHPNVVDRYGSIDSTLYNTGENGAIQFFFDAAGEIKPRVWRDADQRYWYD